MKDGYSAFAQMQRSRLIDPPDSFVGMGRWRKNGHRRRTAGYSRVRQGGATEARARAEARKQAAMPSQLDAWYADNAGRPGVGQPMDLPTGPAVSSRPGRKPRAAMPPAPPKPIPLAFAEMKDDAPSRRRSRLRA